METNRNHSNEPTVGINFFESIPPVGLENYSFRWKNPVDLTHVPNSVENKQTKHDNIRLNEPQNKAVVKGFGSTALFTAGLLAVSKQQGNRIRLDDGISKHSILCTKNAQNMWISSVTPKQSKMKICVYQQTTGMRYSLLTIL
jgi:hypothetical protein